MPAQLDLRKKVLKGEVFGPTIYTAGPILEGEPVNHPLMDAVTTPEEGAAAVVWQKEQGYDFTKVYDHLSPEVYQAIMTAAHQQGMPVAGHVPFAVGLDEALNSGLWTIEHVTGYIDPDAVKFFIPEDRLLHPAASRGVAQHIFHLMLDTALALGSRELALNRIQHGFVAIDDPQIHRFYASAFQLFE